MHLFSTCAQTGHFYVTDGSPMTAASNCVDFDFLLKQFQFMLNIKVGHGWRKKHRLAYFVDVYPWIIKSQIVFWNIVNRK